MFVKKLFLLISMCSLLAACGSGGGGSSATNAASSKIASSKSSSPALSSSKSSSSQIASSANSSTLAYAYCNDLLADPDSDGLGMVNNQLCTIRTSFSITDEMKIGWNLGNTLDAFGGETNWGNPKTTQAMIDKVKQAGFHTLRIPVTWDDFLSGAEHSISSERMNRVEEIANYGLANNMYVIINIHHHYGWGDPSVTNEVNATDHATKIWQQVAAKFKDYDHRIIFETLNEPRVGDDWSGKQEYFTVLNRINKAILATIRQSGGKNLQRLVMIPGYVAGANSLQIDAIEIPTDNMIAISTHAYFPFGFALDSKGTALFTNVKEVDDAFIRLNNKFIKNNIPVVMGEWASTNKDNLAERIKHAEHYVRAAKNARIPTVWWDNGNPTANTSDAMALLDRRQLTWVYPEIVEALMKGIQ